jgi:hypothetical protein
MKFQSQVYTAASGSIGGITFSRNKGGMYTRSKAIPTNPNSIRQQVVRGALGQLSVAWNLLSIIERESWNLYAASVPMVDKLGATIYLSGQQHFIRANVPRLQADLAIVNAAPTTFNLGDKGSIVLDGADISNVLNVGFSGGDGWNTEVGAHLLIYTGRPQNAGVGYCKGPFRYAGKISGAAVSPTSPAEIDNSETEYVFVLGQKVWAKTILTHADGRLSVPSIIGPYIVDAGGN